MWSDMPLEIEWSSERRIQGKIPASWGWLCGDVRDRNCVVVFLILERRLWEGTGTDKVDCVRWSSRLTPSLRIYNNVALRDFELTISRSEAFGNS